MKSIYVVIGVGVLLMAAGLSACVTQPSGHPSSTTVSTPAGWTTSDLVFQYRQQAAELRDMARRLETEAQFYAQRQDQEQARRSLDLAKELRAAADLADEQAREYRSRLPHNQVY
ncbi:MAG: hypothetical protein E6K63_06965 [Nitrospirae bacterium]|nr:MAG: hypothetical protein E6K63_06965 [Nitrospirota bacterium]